MTSRGPLARRVLAAAAMAVPPALLLAAPALAAGSGINPVVPEGVSPNGRNIHDLYLYFITPFALLVFIGVEAALVWVIIKYRRRNQPPGYVPPQWHGNTKVEIVWTVIPTLIILAIGVFSFVELQNDFLKPADNQTDMDLTITGHQFGWIYKYPDGFEVASDGLAVQPMVVPVNKLIRLKLQGTDVIHGWWVPEITGKTDLVPGYDNYTWMKISRPGEWRGQCTELCGAGHATMQLRVKAVSQADYEAFVAEQMAKKSGPSPSASASGSPSPKGSPSPSGTPGVITPPTPSPGPSSNAAPSPSPSR